MKPTKTRNSRQKWLKRGIVASILLFSVWIALGAGSTVAWYTDTPETVINTLIIGDVSVKLSYEKDGSYTEVNESVSIFEDGALYEPGYVQVVLLKIENIGNVGFDYCLQVNPKNAVDALATDGSYIHLPDYLRFGMAVSASESELKTLVANREAAKALAVNALDSSSEKSYGIAPGGSEYAALVVYMPEEIDNAANYRGSVAPHVDLGVTVLASQENTLDKLD